MSIQPTITRAYDEIMRTLMDSAGCGRGAQTRRRRSSRRRRGGGGGAGRRRGGDGLRGRRRAVSRRRGVWGEGRCARGGGALCLCVGLDIEPARLVSGSARYSSARYGSTRYSSLYKRARKLARLGSLVARASSFGSRARVNPKKHITCIFKMK